MTSVILPLAVEVVVATTSGGVILYGGSRDVNIGDCAITRDLVAPPSERDRGHQSPITRLLVRHAS